MCRQRGWGATVPHGKSNGVTRRQPKGVNWNHTRMVRVWLSDASRRRGLRERVDHSGTTVPSACARRAIFERTVATLFQIILSDLTAIRSAAGPAIRVHLRHRQSALLAPHSSPNGAYIQWSRSGPVAGCVALEPFVTGPLPKTRRESIAEGLAKHCRCSMGRNRTVLRVMNAARLCGRPWCTPHVCTLCV